MKLVDANDIAKLIKKTPRQVKERIIFRKDFPHCFDLGKDSRVWDLADIEKWIRSHRAPARRPKQRQSKSLAISSADSL